MKKVAFSIGIKIEYLYYIEPITGPLPRRKRVFIVFAQRYVTGHGWYLTMRPTYQHHPSQLTADSTISFPSSFVKLKFISKTMASSESTGGL